MSENQYKERIAELEKAVDTLNSLWNKECLAHEETMNRYINLAKKYFEAKKAK
jgi:hypothetical protein